MNFSRQAIKLILSFRLRQYFNILGRVNEACFVVVADAVVFVASNVIN